MSEQQVLEHAQRISDRSHWLRDSPLVGLAFEAIRMGDHRPRYFVVGRMGRVDLVEMTRRVNDALLEDGYPVPPTQELIEPIETASVRVSVGQLLGFPAYYDPAHEEPLTIDS